MIILYNKFKTSKNIFKVNLKEYILFVIIVLILFNYRDILKLINGIVAAVINWSYLSYFILILLTIN